MSSLKSSTVDPLTNPHIYPFTRLLVIALFLLTITSVANAKTIYVDIDRPDGGGGTSWADAYRYLQDALAAALDGDEIRVAQGVYKPDEGSGVTDGLRTETFNLINGVTLKGGYAGDGEADPDARDITAYETILSGDLDGNDVEITNPADLLTEPTRQENSYHVVSAINLAYATVVLDGFTIIAGNANETVNPNRKGAGLYAYSCYFTVITVSNCVLKSNSSWSVGGGMYAWCSESQLILTNCTFVGNRAAWGGGLRTLHQDEATLTNCTFIGNLATDVGGGVSTILDNGQTNKLTNCIFSGNMAGTSGGGYHATHDFVTFSNCIFSGNQAGSDGGGFFSSVSGGTVDFNNCILWGNTAVGNGQQLAALTSGVGWTITVNYSDVEDGNSSSAIYMESGNTLVWGSGNLNEAPLFVRNPNDGGDGWGVGDNDDFGDLHLLGDSNCIDAGDNTAIPVGVNEDLDGNPRIIDNTVDMGAYETRPFIYVDTDSAGDNDGTNWTDAYNYLQDGLSAATGGWGEVLVAAGTYKPDNGNDVTTGDRSATFALKSGIDLTGGYAGDGESDPDARNINTYKVILSGDLDGNDIPITDPCELENEPSRAENSYHVVTGADNAAIDGFTITAGNANGSTPDNHGGGMLNTSADPTVVNSTFTTNWASSGGGIYNDASSSPVITGCILHGNNANNGGGMYNSSDSTEVNNCTFSGNTASLDGGGIYSYQTCPVVNSSILYGNTDAGGSDESAQIYPYFYFGSGQVNYSCVQGWGGSLGGTGNISSDPDFVDSSSDDYHIRWSSDCINTGDTGIVFNINERDIDDEPRVMVGRVDMGADETSSKQADFTRNGRIDAEDMGVFVQSWLTIPADADWYILCDLEEDDKIDFKDFADFAGDWLWQASWYEP